MNNLKISLIAIGIGILLSCMNAYSVKASSLTSEIAISDFDESEIYSSFSEIDELVTYIESNTNITYSDLDKNNINHASLSESSSLALFPEEDDDNKFYFNKQTAFLMGCAFGMLGIIAVAIVNNGNSEVVNNSIMGCVTSSCVSLGLSGVIFIIYAFFLSSYYYY